MLPSMSGRVCVWKNKYGYQHSGVYEMKAVWRAPQHFPEFLKGFIRSVSDTVVLRQLSKGCITASDIKVGVLGCEWPNLKLLYLL